MRKTAVGIVPVRTIVAAIKHARMYAVQSAYLWLLLD
jgi:hypothetical protein